MKAPDVIYMGHVVEDKRGVSYCCTEDKFPKDITYIRLNKVKELIEEGLHAPSALCDENNYRSSGMQWILEQLEGLE